MNRLCLRHKKEGHIRLRKNLGEKPKVTKEELQIYIAQNLNFTTADMGRYFKLCVMYIYLNENDFAKIFITFFLLVMLKSAYPDFNK